MQDPQILLFGFCHHHQRSLYSSANPPSTISTSFDFSHCTSSSEELLTNILLQSITASAIFSTFLPNPAKSTISTSCCCRITALHRLSAIPSFTLQKSVCSRYIHAIRIRCAVLQHLEQDLRLSGTGSSILLWGLFRWRRILWLLGCPFICMGGIERYLSC
jgi:hypothetical protein